MKQICYDIFEELANKTHIRELAKRVQSNQMTVSRKLQELEKHNIVDYTFEGKNKYYFRKKSLEAQIYKKQMQHYKALLFLRENPKYRQLVEDILKNSKIKLAIVFGSYAKKSHTKTSDLDLFFENVSKDIINEFSTLYPSLSIKTGKYRKDSLLGREIQKKHIILKGVDYYQNIDQIPINVY